MIRRAPRTGLTARARQHLTHPRGRSVDAAHLGARVPEPHHEQAKMLHATMPVPVGASTPAQKQRDPARIGLRGQLRAIATEPDVAQM
ncbi:MAG: hypothetical protein R2706_11445 [Acidimicrobiales bacterium]